MKIGICGSEGSFSEEATRYYSEKSNIKDFQPNYLITAENVLNALEKNKVDLGIFPIENSNGGVVLESVYAMAKHNFKIEKMFEIDIRHFLLVKPGVKAGEINKIVSHPQALKQCRMYLRRKWGEIELEEYADTAQAAKDLSKNKLANEVAVIAPEICAKLYELEVLEGGIQDLKFNFTTFIVAKNQ